MSMGYGFSPFNFYQQQRTQQQNQLNSLNSQLSSLMLPLNNRAAFSPSSIQNFGPGAAQPNWLNYGFGGEQQFFKPEYMNIGNQLGQSQALQTQIADVQKQLAQPLMGSYGSPMGIYNYF